MCWVSVTFTPFLPNVFWCQKNKCGFVFLVVVRSSLGVNCNWDPSATGLRLYSTFAFEIKFVKNNFPVWCEIPSRVIILNVFTPRHLAVCGRITPKCILTYVSTKPRFHQKCSLKKRQPKQCIFRLFILINNEFPYSYKPAAV